MKQAVGLVPALDKDPGTGFEIARLCTAINNSHRFAAFGNSELQFYRTGIPFDRSVPDYSGDSNVRVVQLGAFIVEFTDRDVVSRCAAESHKKQPGHRRNQDNAACQVSRSDFLQSEYVYYPVPPISSLLAEQAQCQ